jgi:beta-glucosidase
MDVLLRIKNQYTNLPIFVTENGIALYDYVDPTATVRDQERIDFLFSHLQSVNEAASLGVDVRGFFAWSLMDNFEWAMGYSRRYGLIYVDYLTRRRIPKQSASWYCEVIANNGLEK